MIPNNIFKTHKSLDYMLSNHRLKKADYSWRKWQNNGFNYYFYDNDKCNKFMKKYFPEIMEVYNRLPLGVMKADLWRYCIIYKYGGIYHDADTVLKVNPLFLTNYTDKYLVVVPENDTHFCQWVFAAPPNSPVLKSIIDLSVERIRNCREIRGEHIIHYLTGPAVFTDGIFKYLNIPMRLYNKKDYNYLTSDNKPIKYGCEGGIYEYEQGYVKISLGSSNRNRKIIKIDTILDPYQKLSFKHNYIDRFSYKFNENQFIINRTDDNIGWGQDLNVYQFSNKFNILMNIGPSETNSKTVDNKFNSKKELSFIHNYNDTFSYEYNKNNLTLTITRTDIDSGWGQDLDAYYFNCISNIVIMPSNLFHNNWVNHLFSGGWKDGWCKKRDKMLK